MEPSKPKEYKKHNSFVGFKDKDGGLIASAQSRCLSAGKDLEKSELSIVKQNVVRKALDDLSNPAVSSELSKFQITRHVAAEISLLDDSELPRYLFHRYRYEIYPDMKILDDYPPYLQIEPSSICNYRCVFCFETDPTFNSPKNGFMGKMSLELFHAVVDQAVGTIDFISLASRGEPLACKDIDKMLAYTPGKFLNLKMNTNASLMDEAKCHSILSSGIRTLVFSADAAEEPLYSQLRVNGKLDKVLANIRRFNEIREKHYPQRRIITRVSGVKFRQEQNLESMENLWGELVDQVAFVNYNPWENVYEAQPNGLATPCSDLWRRMFVWWDGKTNPCDVDYKSTLSVGNIHKLSISQLWSSAPYEMLRQKHLEKNRQTMRPCNSCTLV